MVGETREANAVEYQPKHSSWQAGGDCGTGLGFWLLMGCLLEQGCGVAGGQRQVVADVSHPGPDDQDQRASGGCGLGGLCGTTGLDPECHRQE